MSMAILIPPRVREIAGQIAQKHEVPLSDVLGAATYRAAVTARLECYLAALKTPKPNGHMPSCADVARWFGRNRATVARAVQHKEAA